MNTQEELFNSIISLKANIQYIAGIVQNEGYTPTQEDLDEWNGIVDRTIEELEEYRKEVIELYSKLIK